MHQTEVPIPAPCPADWNAMTGDARKRFCSTCDKHVHDLSAMTERQARVAAKPGSCVRYAHDRFGRIRHLPTFAIGTLLAGPAFASGMPADGPPSDGLVTRVTRAFSVWWTGERVTIEPLTVVAGGMVAPPTVQVTLAATVPLPTTIEVTCGDTVRTQPLQANPSWVDLGYGATDCTARLGDDRVSFPVVPYTTMRCESASGASCRVVDPSAP